MIRRTRYPTSLVAAALLVTIAPLVTACAGKKAPERIEPQTIQVEVDNGNFLDVVIFGLQDHHATRLGTVSGLMTSTLDVPDHLVVLGRIRILVDPIGSPEAYLTDDIMVSPGDVVRLRVGSMIRLSSWSVRGRAES